MQKKPIYFPGLGGLRAICALAVVIAHTSGSLIKPFMVFGLPMGKSLASEGVTFFFTLSGFLITYLLQEEKSIGTINIKNFYIRRILRIWPLYYLYLILAVLTILIFNIPLTTEKALVYTFFVANIAAANQIYLPILAHYWSLAVEEQFYLFWPVLNKVSKNLMKISIIGIVCMVLLKLTLLVLKLWVAELVVENMCFHLMAIGGIAALLVRSNNKVFLSFADNKITQCICWSIMFIVAINRYKLPPFDHEVTSFVAAAMIVGQIRVENRLINLERPIFRYLGKLSYGIYIIHLIVIFFINKFFDIYKLPTPLNYIAIYLSVISITILLAHLSYKYYESYFLRLKNKFEAVKSSATPA